MRLSKRLEAAAGMVDAGCRLADIGTDHGYLPIYLVQQERIPGAIAMDVRKGPLARADMHIRQYGLEDRIETRLSDGLSSLKKGEADCMAAAGMGGSLTIHILETGAEVVAGMRFCILQPQSDIDKVRKYLWQHTFAIVEEQMVWEEGKFYPMMKAVPGKKQEIAEELLELYAQYGQLLLDRRHPVLKQFLQKEKRIKQQLLSHLEAQLPGTKERLAEIQGQLRLVKQAEEYMRKETRT